MSHFTIEQKVNIVAWAITYKNCEKSVRSFAETHHVDPPSVRTIRYCREISCWKQAVYCRTDTERDDRNPLQQKKEVRLCHSERLTLTVWACIGHTGVVSYDISRDTMNSMRYCQVLQEKVIGLPSSSRNRQWWFQPKFY